MMNVLRRSAMLCLLVPALWLVPSARPLRAAEGLRAVSHLLVIYLENRSFDNLLGEFPGADGIADAGERAIQRDRAGQAFTSLPQPARRGPFDSRENPKPVRSLALGELPNRPFAIDAIQPEVTATAHTRDLVHRFYTHKAQIHGGANDRFAALSDAGGLAMGYYSRRTMEASNLWRLAQANLLLDHFHQGAFGGSFLNHFWLVCGCAPVWPHPPPRLRAQLDGEGIPLAKQDNAIVAAGHGDFAVNSLQSVYLNDGSNPEDLLRGQHMITIGDRLSERGIGWAWYAGGWSLAIKADRSPQEGDILDRQLHFQWHHQPFAYFRRFDPATERGRQQRRQHLKDAGELEADIASGRLPPVAFYKPSGNLDSHPDYSTPQAGDEQLGQIAAWMQASPMKASYAIIILFDESGGFWDHAPPPMGRMAGRRADFFGPGSRVPALIVSPLVRKGEIDHTPYETTSILRLITERFRLKPLPSPRARTVTSLSRAFISARR